MSRRAPLLDLVYWSTVVDSWAARAKGTGEQRNYSVPGTYGDSFAPIVGVFTALALAATVASAWMQREELREAREQFTAQAQALDEANRIASASNDLQRSAQLLEAMRQIAEVDRLSLAIITPKWHEQHRRDQESPGLVAQRRAAFGGFIKEPLREWDAYWRADLGQKLKSHRAVDSPELRILADNRKHLDDIVSRLRGDAALPS